MSIELIGSLAAAIATLASAAMSAHLGRMNTPKSASHNGDQLQLRIQEITETIIVERKRSNTHRYAGALLTFTQFIIGGLLASSFLRESLTQDIVGVLGLLVLFSSLVRQHYKPEIQHLAAQRRAIQLQALIRYAEDVIYEKQGTGSESVPSKYELLKYLTSRLDAIEASKIEEKTAEIGEPKGKA
jgi:hypothetical protein